MSLKKGWGGNRWKDYRRDNDRDRDRQRGGGGCTIRRLIDDMQNQREEKLFLEAITPALEKIESQSSESLLEKRLLSLEKALPAPSQTQSGTASDTEHQELKKKLEALEKKINGGREEELPADGRLKELQDKLETLERREEIRMAGEKLDEQSRFIADEVQKRVLALRHQEEKEWMKYQQEKDLAIQRQAEELKKQSEAMHLAAKQTMDEIVMLKRQVELERNASADLTPDVVVSKFSPRSPMMRRFGKGPESKKQITAENLQYLDDETSDLQRSMGKATMLPLLSSVGSMGCWFGSTIIIFCWWEEVEKSLSQEPFADKIKIICSGSSGTLEATMPEAGS